MATLQKQPLSAPTGKGKNQQTQYTHTNDYRAQTTAHLDELQSYSASVEIISNNYLEDEQEMIDDTSSVKPTDPIEFISTDDMVGLYLKETAKVPLLTEEEELELAKRIEKARNARNELSNLQWKGTKVQRQELFKIIQEPGYGTLKPDRERSIDFDNTENIVIVGAVALGAKAACRFKRLRQDANVTIIDKDELISYGGCGIPFYVAGDVSDETELRSTSFHMVRDEKFFLNDKGVVAMTGTEVTKIDRSKKTVHIKKSSGEEGDISYDKLVLATGSVPRKLDMPGTNLKNVFNVSNLRDAIAIKKKITQGQVEKAVIIGAGFIGLEMAQALADMWEIETTVIEYFDQVMPGFVSHSISLMAQRCMEKDGVKFHFEEIVQALEGDEYVTAVKTNKRTVPADMVIMSVGIVPNTILAKEAGIETGPGGHIIVNERMQTSDPDIYSGGDCVLIKNLVTDKAAYIPLESMANRQGRVIGTNLAGGDARFKGGVGSFVVKIFEKSLAGAGLTIDVARKEGFDAVSIQVAQFDRAHFYPEKEIIYLELVVDRKTRTVLGIQGWGGEGSEMVGRINAVAPLIMNKAKVEDVSNLEIAYSPPFASAMDIVNALGNTTENFLDGMYKPMQMEEFIECWKSRNNGDCFFLDCRADADAIPFQEKFPEIWKSIPHDELERRCDEVPRDKKIILLCNTGIRSYEAQINLAAHGIEDTVSVESGISGLKDCGIEF